MGKILRAVYGQDIIKAFLPMEEKKVTARPGKGDGRIAGPARKTMGSEGKLVPIRKPCFLPSPSTGEGEGGGD
jgi:hypothetical protein